MSAFNVLRRGHYDGEEWFYVNVCNYDFVLNWGVAVKVVLCVNGNPSISLTTLPLLV